MLSGIGRHDGVQSFLTVGATVARRASRVHGRSGRRGRGWSGGDWQDERERCSFVALVGDTLGDGDLAISAEGGEETAPSGEG